MTLGQTCNISELHLSPWAATVRLSQDPEQDREPRPCLRRTQLCWWLHWGMGIRSLSWVGPSEVL